MVNAKGRAGWLTAGWLTAGWWMVKQKDEHKFVNVA
jgi:uncharacterized membrane protein